MTVKIPVGSELHTKVLSELMDRKKFSEKKMSEFHKQWNDAEDSMKAYIHERELDKRRKDKKDYAGEVDYVTMEVPYVYATVMTAHTYYSSVMLGRSPIWQYSARHGEPQNSVMAVEAVMDYQNKVGGHLPVMYNWLYDLARYSIAVVGCYWDEDEVTVSERVQVQSTVMGIPFGSPKTQFQTKTVPGYCGNKLYNIRPYDFLPDPRVPIWKFQEGEFCGRKTIEGFHNLTNSAQIDPERYQNLEVLQKYLTEKQANTFGEEASSRVNRPYGPGEGGEAPGTGSFCAFEMAVKLIPSLWNLSASKRLETWVFEVAEDKYIISARPQGLYHNKFSYAVMEGNFGSEEFAKFGMLEIIRPMTDVLTWLINTHFYNVRRILNNQLVVDPSRVVMKDLTKPGQRIIRLKPNAYGTDARAYVHQLQASDVTRTHIADVSVMESLIQRVSSVVDNVMGVPQRGGRKTATEVRDSTGWSVSRLKTPVEYNSGLAFDPLAQIMLSNTQQLLSVERKYAIAGNTLEGAEKFLQVDPGSIAGFYDFVPIDGTLPIDRLAQANFWKELIMQMVKSPEIAMQWDINGMIAHTMKMQGERNIDRFQIKMTPDEQLANQVQKGNLVPIGGAGGRGRGGPPAGGGPSNRATGTSGGTI